MAIIDEDGFSRLLKAPLKDHIFCIFGDDAYLKEVYADRLQKAVIKDDALSFFNLHTYEDDETPLEDILEDADILPVMTDRTCLLIKNYPLSDLGEEALKTLETNLRETPETSVLIFHYSAQDFTNNKREYPKWNRVITMFSKCGVAVELSHRTQRKMIQMLIKGAGSRGASIGEAEAEYLINICGDDLGNLLNEFNKLCSYADGSPITTEMIDSIATKSVEASVFDISAMIFSGDADRAFAIVYELLRQKTPMQSIIGALNQSYMTVYRYKVMKTANKSLQELTEDMGYKTDQSYVFRKIAAFANKTDISRIRRSLDILIEADIASKSTAASPETLLTGVIAKLCAV